MESVGNTVVEEEASSGTNDKGDKDDCSRSTSCKASACSQDRMEIAYNAWLAPSILFDIACAKTYVQSWDRKR